MKLSLFLFCSVLLGCWVSPMVAQGNFEKHFEDRTMRVDYYHFGDAKTEGVTLDRVMRLGSWYGPVRELIDPFNVGHHCVKVYDAISGDLIYSRGYDSYFHEYQTTGQALKGVNRVYHETAMIPWPRRPIRFTVESRDSGNVLQPVFSQVIDPSSYTIEPFVPDPAVRVLDVEIHGDPKAKVDVAILAEGYTLAEEGKLRTDLERFRNSFFGFEPYRTLREKFNVRCIFKPSLDSGCDEPSHASFRRTVMDCTFDSLGSERYLLTENNRAVRDLASHAPCDTVFIMVNHKRYGGGGIYNYFCTFTTDNQWFEYLLLHEFGHSFGALADEYYTSSTAYDAGLYPPGVEPLEANITALKDPDTLKWKNLVTSGTPLPTPWEKEEFDRQDLAYQKIRQEVNEKIAAAKRAGASREEVAKLEEESERLSRDAAGKSDAFLLACKAWGKVGAFEGAGYSSKGLFRSQLDCIMFTKGKKPYCKVCEDTIARVIRHYCE